MNEFQQETRELMMPGCLFTHHSMRPGQFWGDPSETNHLRAALTPFKSRSDEVGSAPTAISAVSPFIQ